VLRAFSLALHRRGLRTVFFIAIASPIMVWWEQRLERRIEQRTEFNQP
jgi:hypothetical protein